MRTTLSPVSCSSPLLWCSRAAPTATVPTGTRGLPHDGWTIVHLTGTPAQVGWQHGSLLYAEINRSQKAIELSVTHEVGHSWAELRAVSQKVFLPKLPAEYRQELEGIVKGVQSHGSKLDLLDLVTMNGYMEFDYYYGELKRRTGIPSPKTVAERCQRLHRHRCVHQRRPDCLRA